MRRRVRNSPGDARGTAGERRTSDAKNYAIVTRGASGSFSFFPRYRVTLLLLNRVLIDVLTHVRNVARMLCQGEGPGYHVYHMFRTGGRELCMLSCNSPK